MLRQKYSRKKIDVIIAVMGPSLDFVLRHADEIAPGTPIVFCGVDRREIESRPLVPNVTGVLVKRDFKGTLDVALELSPNTQQVVFIAGNADFDKRLTEQAMADFKPYEDRLKIRYLTKFALSELLEEVSELPPNTIILTSTVFSDSAGQTYVPHDVVTLISQRANAPVYAFIDQYLGRGIIGGRLYSLGAHGNKAAELALQILEGKKVADLPIVESDVSSFMFDSRQLQRWNIPESSLPEGSTVLFKEPSLWEEYKWYVFGAASVVGVEALLIGWLLLLRSRRRTAERERNRFQELAKTEHRRLDDIVRNVPGVVWETRLRSGPDDRECIFISDYSTELFGYTPDEYMAGEPGLITKLVVDEQREWFNKEVRRAIEESDESVIPFKILTKTGEEKWVEGHIAVVRDESGTALGVRGVTMDITDRKLAEERVAIKQLQLTEAQRLAQVGSWEWDERTGEVTWSDEIYRIYGLDPSQPAASFADHERLLLPESWERLRLEVENTLKTGEPYDIEIEFVRVEGGRGWGVARGEFIVLANGSRKLRGTLQDITARKRTEEELVKSEERYRNVVETQTELICRYLPDTTLTFVNDAYCRYFNRSQTELVGTKFIDFIPPDARDASLAHIASVLETRQPAGYEHEVVRSDGTRGWQHWTDSPVKTINGDPQELQGIGRDITERQLAVERLRASEARFRTLADSAPVLIWMTDTDAEWTFFNKRAVDFTGMETGELRVRGWIQLVHEEDRQHVVNTYAQAYARIESYKMEYRLLDGKGDYRWLHDTGVPHFSPKNEFIGFIGTCTDVTELKSAVAAIRESEERFRHIADSAPVLIWISDAQGRNTFMNQFGLDYTGLSEDAVKGSGWLASLHKDDTKPLIEAYRDGHERQVPVVTEFRLRGADGNYRWFFSTSTPRIDENGKFLGSIGTCVDIDDRKQTENALHLALSEINQLKNKLQEENIYLKEEIKLIHDFEEIVGESEALKYVLFKIEQVAPTNATVLITGETGTGKELVARAVHSASYLKNRPLVKVNCAALAANFIESELFGHEKGSFTGATGRRIGRFELAHGGTIFLDEIGELPLDLQVKLLRVLQEGEFERLGSSKTIKVDVRVIAATNRDLRAEVEKGSFREDLLFRLNVFPITVPPLRERKDDIPLLVNYFVQWLCKRLGKRITSVAPGVMRTLMDHSWPGNIRELANVIERSVISTKGETLKSIEGMDSATASNGSGAVTATLEQVERDYISEILRSTDWKIEGKGGAANILGLHPSTLRTRMQKLGIMRVSKKHNGS